MLRAVRLTVAMLLAGAIAGLPIVLDQCAASCDAHQSAATATPPCHHAQTTGAQFQPASPDCHHDHAASLGALPSTTSPQERHGLAMPWTPFAESMTSHDSAFVLVSTHAPPDLDSGTHARSLPLRI